MAYQLNLTPKEYDVEDPHFGSFKIIPMAINKDLELEQISKEVQTDLDKLESYSKEDKKLSKEELKAREKEVVEMGRRIEARKSRLYEIWKSVFIFEDEKKKEELFNTVTLEQIRKIHMEVIANA